MKRLKRKENLNSILSIVKEIYGLVPVLFSDGEYISEIQEETENLIVNTEYVNPLDIRVTINRYDGKYGNNHDRIYRQLWNVREAVCGDAYVIIDDYTEDEQSSILQSIVYEDHDQDIIFFYVKNQWEEGTAQKGYKQFFKSITKQVQKYGREKNVVNLLGIIPGEDLHFRGNLDAIEEILKAAGCQVNRFFGTLTGVWELENISRAALNLSFSGQGEEVAKLLLDSYNTPYLNYTGIPIGPAEVRRLLQDVEQQLDLAEGELTSSGVRMEEYFQYYLKGIYQSFYQRNYSKWIGLIGTESDVLSIGNFLKNYLGAGIRFVIITDGERYWKQPAAMRDFAGKIYFSSNKEEIKMIVAENDIELLVGSSEQRDITKLRNIPLLEYSAPLYKKAILSKSYAGIRGAVSLMEDYVTAIERG